MNDKIKLLAEQAEQATKEHFNFDWDGTPRELFDMYFNEKFAELIVRECASIVLDVGTSAARINNMERYRGCTDAGKLIKQHFGVKE